MEKSQLKSVAEVEGFITLLRVACEEQDVYQRLEEILSLPDEHRKTVIQALLSSMRSSRAPEDFVAAIACLIDTEITEKAYEVIFKCKRRIEL